MSYLYCYLEAIETSRLWNLDFLAETLNQVFIDNAIASSEECKNVLDEIPFIILRHTGKRICILIRLAHQACRSEIFLRCRGPQLLKKQNIKISPKVQPSHLYLWIDRLPRLSRRRLEEQKFVNKMWSNFFTWCNPVNFLRITHLRIFFPFDLLSLTFMVTR